MVFHLIAPYFIHDRNVDKMECKRCRRRVSCRTFCMRRHLAKCSKVDYENFERQANTKRDKVQKLKSNPKPALVCMSWTWESFEEFCLGLVVKDGVDLTTFSAPTFSNVFKGVSDELNFSLEPWSIRNLILEKYFAKKYELVDKLRHRYLFLKLDHTREGEGENFVALSCQFVDENAQHIVSYTLAVTKVTQDQAHSVKEFLTNTLLEFEIERHQIMTIVTDSAPRHPANERAWEIGDTRKDIDKSFADNGNDEDLDGIEEMIASPYVDVANNFLVKSMRCGGNVFQKILITALDTCGCEQLLTNLELIVKVANNPVIREQLQIAPEKDQVFRMTKIEIIARSCELKEKYQTLEGEQQTLMQEHEWVDLIEMNKVLASTSRFVTQLQEENLRPGKFWFLWSKVKRKMVRSRKTLRENSVEVRLCTAIIDEMNKQEQELLKNPLLLAAIYVDPQFRDVLDDDDYLNAKEAFVQVAMHLFKQNKRWNAQESSLPSLTVQESSFPSLTMQESSFPSLTMQESSFPSLTMQESGFPSLTVQPHVQIKQEPVDERLPQVLLDEIQTKRRRLSPVEPTSKLERELRLFKVAMKDCLRELERVDVPVHSLVDSLLNFPAPAQQTAICVTGLPTSQVSTNQLLSAVKLLSSSQVKSLPDDLLDAILFLRTNGLK